MHKKDNGWAIMMDLSKASETINHEFLIVKLNAYNFSRSSLVNYQ